MALRYVLSALKITEREEEEQIPEQQQQDQNGVDDNLDEDGFLRARARATARDIFEDRYALVDHLSGKQCDGCAQGSFYEIQKVWSDHQGTWASAWSETCREVVERLKAQALNETRNDLALERIIKWKFLLPTLLFHKPPSPNGTKAKDLKMIVSRCMRQYDEGLWKDLIEEYERDIIIAQGLHHEEQSDDNKELSTIRKAADLISRFQLSKARMINAIKRIGRS